MEIIPVSANLIQALYDENLRPVLSAIKRLEIQGATNVALEGIKAFSVYASKVYSAFSNDSDYVNHLE